MRGATMDEVTEREIDRYLDALSDLTGVSTSTLRQLFVDAGESLADAVKSGGYRTAVRLIEAARL